MTDTIPSPPPVTTLSEYTVRTLDVKRVYKMGTEEVHALKGVTISISRGEYISIMGPSGSGKSTLFNMVGGLDKPSEGKVYIDEVDIAQLDAYELAWMRCHKIGYIFQTFNLLPTQTALENVMFPMIIAGLKTDEAQDKAAEILKRVELGHRLFNRPAEMSGGQQQRVAIARAFANDPAIILADEPTGNLDLQTGKLIIELLRQLNKERGVTIISATHDHKMLAVSDRIFWIRDGKVDRIQRRDELKIEEGVIEGAQGESLHERDGRGVPLSETPPQLDYAPRPSPLRHIRRRALPLLTLLVVGALLWCCRDLVQQKVDQGLLLFRQHRALRYTIDPERVVYEENGDAQAALLKQSDYREFYRANMKDRLTAWDPRLWDPLWTSWPDGTIAPGPRALVFLHERTNQRGEKLLLAVHACVVTERLSTGPTEALVFEVREMQPGDWTHTIIPANGLTTKVTALDFRGRRQPLRIYGGQADPNDLSHFTIRYQVGGEDGILDGWEGTRKEDANGIPTPGLRLDVRQPR